MPTMATPVKGELHRPRDIIMEAGDTCKRKVLILAPTTTTGANFSGAFCFNVRMIHHGQRLAFGLKSGDDLFGIHAELDHLERDAAADWLGLLGDINHTASPFANLLQQLVAAKWSGQRSYRAARPRI